ncbi:MAG: hypothetical protein J6580_09975 [Gilliamella sp.]|uniref:pyocin knob domain-containing protein n=1 Tax=Gilliamella sp. TaxID=1891236 RepID=UPI0025E8300B|nr:pyocin knob domain-containing protein [Gilliamella sp.]MCO6550990.1 hypothetical protein [Gilliamella sp.]
MSWYKTGAVNVTNNSKIVTGINTKWTNPLIGICSGQMLMLQTSNTIEIYEIASVQSDTQLTLAKNYSGASKTGVSYEIPTSPKVSIEALALRVSEMLNYYQTQLDAWQTLLTGDGEVTLTAPDGQVVTIKSQYSIQKELIKLVEQGKVFAQSARESATTATNANTSAKSYSDSSKSYADSASASATASRNSAQQSSNSANAAKVSENNAKTSEQNAKKSADDAKKFASTIDTSKLLKIGDAVQLFGDLSNINLNSLTGLSEGVYFQGKNVQATTKNNYPINEAGTLQVLKNGADGAGCCQIYTAYRNARQFIRNFRGGTKTWEPWVEQITTANINKYIPIGDQRLMPFRRDELPFGWYFRNGDNFLLDSPQGQALNGLSVNYKRDHNITKKKIDGKQYINVPTAFSSDGRGFFERAVNGASRQVGSVEGDAIRNIWGQLYNVMQWRGTVGQGVFYVDEPNASGSGLNNRNGNAVTYPSDSDFPERTITFDASRVVPVTADDNRPLNIGMTPVIYLGV